MMITADTMYIYILGSSDEFNEFLEIFSLYIMMTLKKQTRDETRSWKCRRCLQLIIVFVFPDQISRWGHLNWWALGLFIGGPLCNYIIIAGCRGQLICIYIQGPWLQIISYFYRLQTSNVGIYIYVYRYTVHIYIYICI